MTDVRRISGLLPFAISQRLLADLHHGPTCYIASGDIQETWVPCSRLREHVPASPGAGALHAHGRVSMAPKEDPNRGGDRRGVSIFPVLSSTHDNSLFAWSLAVLTID